MCAEARSTFVDLPSADQQTALGQVKSFFKTGTEKLLLYLPFDSHFLVSCKFLSPANQNSSHFESWVMTIASELPTIIKPSEFSTLEVESRLLNSGSICMGYNPTVTDYWKAIAEKTLFQHWSSWLAQWSWCLMAMRRWSVFLAFFLMLLQRKGPICHNIQ